MLQFKIQSDKLSNRLDVIRMKVTIPFLLMLGMHSSLAHKAGKTEKIKLLSAVRTLNYIPLIWCLTSRSYIFILLLSFISYSQNHKALNTRRNIVYDTYNAFRRDLLRSFYRAS